MRRRRTSAPKSPAPRVGGRRPAPAAPRLYEAPARPAVLVAEVVEIGAHRMARLLHRELGGMEWRMELPPRLSVAPGDFVRGTPAPHQRAVLVVAGKIPPEMAATAAAIANHGLSEGFSKPEEHQAAQAPAYRFTAKEGRSDWRALPFITIDGEDARDFDDAVQAEPLPKSKGWLVRVAIADVAHYVSPGSALDMGAAERGNSTYFPNRVLPMLPERLSNNLCSLNPAADRPVLGVAFTVSAAGEIEAYQFQRAAIHSHARCTYTQVQQVLEGKSDSPLHQDVLGNIKHLNDVFEALLQAREVRGAISLEVPEVKLELDTQGRVSGANPRPRLAAHMLIEELMIAANVCAAHALANGTASTMAGHTRRHKGVAGVFRVHAPPSREKLETLRTVLAPLGFTAPAPNAAPRAWAELARKVQSHPAAPTLQRALLQSQMQAQYAHENIGHYGLALPLYTHFTSPIRRYADLLVHRAILALLELEPTSATSAAQLEKTLTLINRTERRSQQAEWEARDRMVADWLAHHVGKEFEATVVNVAPFGCFVSINDGMAEALLPKWQLEGWEYVGSLAAFRRSRGKGSLRAGSIVPVKLLQADVALGRLTVGMMEEKPKAPPKDLTKRPRRR